MVKKRKRLTKDARVAKKQRVARRKAIDSAVQSIRGYIAAQDVDGLASAIAKSDEDDVAKITPADWSAILENYIQNKTERNLAASILARRIGGEKVSEQVATKDDVKEIVKETVKELKETVKEFVASQSGIVKSIETLTAKLHKSVPSLAATIAEGAVLPRKRDSVYWGASATFTVFHDKSADAKGERIYAVGAAHCVLFHAAQDGRVWAFLPSQLTAAGVEKVGFASELATEQWFERRHDFVVVKVKKAPPGIKPIPYPATDQRVRLDDGEGMYTVGGAAASGVVFGHCLQTIPKENESWATGTFVFFLEVGEGGCSGTALFTPDSRWAGVFFGCIGPWSPKDNYRGLCVPIPQFDQIHWHRPLVRGPKKWRGYALDLVSNIARDREGHAHHGVLLKSESQFDGSNVIAHGYLCGGRASE